MMFYKNVRLEKVSEDEYLLTIKVDEITHHCFKLKADQLEHLISQYRQIK